MDAKPPRRPPLAIGSAKRELPRSRSVLLLVDFINPLRFDGAEDIATAALEAAKATAALKRRVTRRGIPTIYANDNYGVWRSEFSDVLAHCLELPGEASEIAKLLSPQPADLTILKPRHSGFYATPLDLLLTQMQVRRIIVAGLATDICVQLTVMDAHLRGYETWVPADCTAAESTQAKNASLEYMARVNRTDTRSASVRAAHGAPRGAGVEADDGDAELFGEEPDDTARTANGTPFA
jgi:nicotinamidase-related amidase